MKKRILLILSICLILLTVVSLTACKGDTVTTKAPTKFKLDTDTLVLSWGKITDARGYEIKISGDERVRTVKSPSYSLEYLAPGSYVIEIRALNYNPEILDSEWVSYEFDRATESGLKFNLINNKSEYEVVGSGTAFGDVVIEDYYRGKPVTKIADSAFSKNKKITSVVVGNNVKSIGKKAFTQCSELTSITIPGSVTSIGNNAFQSCKKLTSIEIPGSVAAIGSATFSHCSALTSVTIGNGVQSIADNAFAECSALTSITLPDSITTVGEYAFTKCVALSTANLGNGVKSLSSYAFFNCESLATLDLGTSVQTIGNGAFTGCAALAKVDIPDSVSVIGAEAFVNCSSLKNITLGSGLTQIGIYAFYGTIPHQVAHGKIVDPDLLAESTGETELTPKKAEIFYLGDWLIEAVNRDLTTATLPAGIRGIADNAFQSCKSLASATLTDVKYVGGAAFAYCEKLSRVSNCTSILVINDYAFYECIALNNFDRYNTLNVIHIGNSAFENCKKLEDRSIQLPGYDKLKYLGGNAFFGTIPFADATASNPIVCIDSWVVGIKEGMYVSQVDIPDANNAEGKNTPIEAIGNYAFQNAMFFGGAVWMPNSIKYIGRGAFYNLNMIKGIGGAASLEYIDDYAFYGCASAWLFSNSVEKGVVQLPAGVKYVGRSAFYQCASLIGVKFPASVETIGAYAFYGCTNMGQSEIWASIDDFKAGLPALSGPVSFAHVNEGSKLKSIGERAFQGCIGIQEVVLPSSLTDLGARAFYGCTNLNKVEFTSNPNTPDLDLVIPDYTFYKCENLTTLVISHNVTRIGNYAFKDCAALDSIVMGNKLEYIGNYAFYGCSSVKSIVFSNSVKEIGNYAFKGCALVDSVVIPETLQTIGKHAFYGLNTATFFVEAESIMPYWNSRWNSSYRAILWGCELSEDNSYVVSYNKDINHHDNLSSPNATLAPEREGYTFSGWATDASATKPDYDALQMAEIPNGTTLYAVWDPITPAA